VKRYLAYSGYKVTLVVNITDVDDKLIAESNSRGIPMAQLAAEMTTDYMNNLAALGSMRSTASRVAPNDRRDHQVHANARREGFRLRGPRRRVLRGRQVSRLRQAEPSGVEATQGDGAEWPSENAPAPTCSVEGGQAGRAIVASPGATAGPAGT